MKGPSRPVLAAFLGLAAASCGGDRSSSPGTVPATPDPRLPAGSVIAVLSGETGAPLPGATVTVAGQSLASDAAGAARLPEPVAPGAPMDIIAPGMLDRQTSLRAAGEQFLWPRTTGSGIDENYTAHLVYTAATREGGPVGALPLLRLAPSTTRVVVVPAADILADDRGHETHLEAAGILTAATGGVIQFTLAAVAPPSGVVVTARVDPAHETCTERVRGFASVTLRAGDIVEGQVVYCDDEVARSPTVLHELGHAFGLRHSPDARDVMFGTFVRGRSAALGPREILIMNLMLRRPSGNRFPDNDRGAGSAAADGDVHIVCR